MDDLTQVTQMLNWLESERRKDKAALATLEQKANGLANELVEQSRRVQELQTALTATQIALSKLPQFERVLEQFKTDLIGEMDRRDDSQQKSVREADRLRKVEVESIGRAITEIRKELPRIKPLEDELPMRRAEERRLGEVLARVGQRDGRAGGAHRGPRPKCDLSGREPPPGCQAHCRTRSGRDQLCQTVGRHVGQGDAVGRQRSARAAAPE